jgi:hypothetical protein
MYYKIMNNLKKYYKNEEQLLKRIEDINNYFNKKCIISNEYFKLVLIYEDEIIKINILHTNGYIEVC